MQLFLGRWDTRSEKYQIFNGRVIIIPSVMHLFWFRPHFSYRTFIHFIQLSLIIFYKIEKKFTKKYITSGLVGDIFSMLILSQYTHTLFSWGFTQFTEILTVGSLGDILRGAYCGRLTSGLVGDIFSMLILSQYTHTLFSWGFTGPSLLRSLQREVWEAYCGRLTKPAYQGASGRHIQHIDSIPVHPHIILLWLHPVYWDRTC